MSSKKPATPASAASPHQDTHPDHKIPHAKNPGGVHQGNEQDVPLGGCIYASSPIVFNEDRPVTKVKVRNTGDRPIQIGSHFHFFEPVNLDIVTSPEPLMPSLTSTFLIVRKIILISSHKDRLSIYQTSSLNLSSHDNALRPLI